jgi:micrococcal nuclease
VSWARKANIDPARAYPVIEVIDGDTLKTYIDGHEAAIRLLGIDTPEVVDPRKPVQCYGPEASQETKSLLAGASSSVYIAFNPAYERVDMYGRFLAYVRRSSDGLFINEFLVANGYAREYTFDEKKPYQYQSLFKRDEAAAKRDGKGLWGACNEK